MHSYFSKLFRRTFIFILATLSIFLISSTVANATNYCVSGNNSLDCSVSGVYIKHGAAVLGSDIVNNGQILGDNPSGAWWSAITNEGGNYTHSIVNNGTITSWVDTIANYSSNYTVGGAMGRISGGITNNAGATISGFHAIVNDYGDWTTPSSVYISTIYNAGSIIGYNQNTGYGSTDQYIGILNSGTIDTITNIGSIYVDRNPNISYGILNIGTITTLNNSQGLGNAHGALTLSGNLPGSYNIIINSPTSYGQLAVTGPSGLMNFGIYNTSSVVAHTYTSVLSGVPTGELPVKSGTYAGLNWVLSPVGGAGNVWDLIFSGGSSGPSSTDTQAALTRTASRLRSVYNKAFESSNFPTSNTYDCNLFDARGMCVSAGGRYTSAENPHSHSTAAVLVLGYKVSDNLRIGGFLDQSIDNSAPAGIQISNKNPMMGAFVYWNQNADGLGYQVKLANTYQDKDITLTRDVIGTSESGTGKTGLTTESYVGELSYALAYQDKTILRPYLGLRYTSIEQDGYTETGVTTPLTYSALKDETTAALIGVKFKHQLTEKATLTGSLGIEQDLHHKAGNFIATGVSGLTAENFSGDLHRTRGLASLGAYYAVAQSQRISGEVMLQELPFQNSLGATAYVNYMIGF